MALNIKNERVCALAREVAQRTGQTQTAAIESALEARLKVLVKEDDAQRKRDERELEARRQRVDALLARIHATVTDEDRGAAWRMMDDLYDPETGLPR